MKRNEPSNTNKTVYEVNLEMQNRLLQEVYKRGLSTSEIARMINQPQSTVYRLLHNKTANPNYGLVYLIFTALDLAFPHNHD